MPGRRPARTPWWTVAARWWGWLDKAALAVPFLVIVAFGLRPYVQHVRGVSNNGKLVRTYAEIALHWVNWYLGIPVILLATVGAALLTRKVLPQFCELARAPRFEIALLGTVGWLLGNMKCISSGGLYVRSVVHACGDSLVLWSAVPGSAP
jgi:hypothetical protein